MAHCRARKIRRPARHQGVALPPPPGISTRSLVDPTGVLAPDRVHAAAFTGECAEISDEFTRLCASAWLMWSGGLHRPNDRYQDRPGSSPNTATRTRPQDPAEVGERPAVTVEECARSWLVVKQQNGSRE